MNELFVNLLKKWQILLRIASNLISIIYRPRMMIAFNIFFFVLHTFSLVLRYFFTKKRFYLFIILLTIFMQKVKYKEYILLQ